MSPARNEHDRRIARALRALAGAAEPDTEPVETDAAGALAAADAQPPADLAAVIADVHTHVAARLQALRDELSAARDAGDARDVADVTDAAEASDDPAPPGRSAEAIEADIARLQRRLDGGHAT